MAPVRFHHHVFLHPSLQFYCSPFLSCFVFSLHDKCGRPGLWYRAGHLRETGCSEGLRRKSCGREGWSNGFLVSCTHDLICRLHIIDRGALVYRAIRSERSMYEPCSNVAVLCLFYSFFSFSIFYVCAALWVMTDLLSHLYVYTLAWLEALYSITISSVSRRNLLAAFGFPLLSSSLLLVLCLVPCLTNVLVPCNNSFKKN